jgi:hypothetical protein
MKSNYNYPEIINWLQAKGVELYGNHFKILESDYPIIYKLIAYFLKDEATSYQYNINLTHCMVSYSVKKYVFEKK